MPEFWITLLEQLKESKVALLILAGAGMFLVIGGLAALSHCYTLSGIKSRTVGDGQHGTARWATAKEIKKIYAHVPFRVRDWRSGHNRPAEQGLVLGLSLIHIYSKTTMPVSTSSILKSSCRRCCLACTCLLYTSKYPDAT